MILDVGIGEKRKETRFLESVKSNSYTNVRKSVIVHNLHLKDGFQM